MSSASRTSQQQVLMQPTFDDFMLLSDDDLLEAGGPPPASALPPLPPPKNTSRVSSPKKRPGPVATQPTHANKASSGSNTMVATGELTPPETPTDSQFLALPPPANTSSHLGALMAAEIAKTYGFDLVYVVSLWPAGGGAKLDPSRTKSSALHPSQGACPGDLPPVNHSSKMNGRFLAAYGLDQVPAPFPLDIKAHIPAMKSQSWREWRDPGAAIDSISLGWGHSFYSSQVPSSPPIGGHESPSKKTMHRGIVFAGFSKGSKPSVIPTTHSPEREMILEGLYLNAKILVDTMIEQF